MVGYQEMPQSIVMDPLAKIHEIPVEYYVGVPVEQEDLEAFILRTPGNPLENYVARKSKEEHEKRLEDMYMEAYCLQMAHEPHYFPKKLREFAAEKNLPFPDKQLSEN